MPVEPINLTAITAVVMGLLVVLIPIAGVTLRFAIKPITESVARLRESGVEREKIDLLERRMALLEQELHGLGGMREDLARALEETEFQRQLRSPQPAVKELPR
jgi:hypothetical protein